MIKEKKEWYEMKMAIPVCPFCGAKHNPVRCDGSESKTHCTCNKCKESYTIISGNGECRTEKGYA